MSQAKPRCLIVLSSKSSGSSALQRLLAGCPQVKHIDKSRHYQHETLFWTKAASILGLPQDKMPDSEVPIPQAKAKTDLIQLLTDNLPDYNVPTQNDALIFDGWRKLCYHHAPVFLEKSPHHLHQWSALELILEAMQRLTDIDFLIIGLVRNPASVLYSMWDRWRYVPERHQHEWHKAYENLRRLQMLLKDKMVLVRYEDMVADPQKTLACVLEFIGESRRVFENHNLHKKSVEKWKTDPCYGFHMDQKVVALAESFGYTHAELVGKNNFFWPLYRHVQRTLYVTKSSVKNIMQN